MHKNKKVIENLFKKKIKLIKEHNKHYFERDNPKIDDATYDKLKNELIELEKNTTFLKVLPVLVKLLVQLRLQNLERSNIISLCYHYQILLIKKTWRIS